MGKIVQGENGSGGGTRTPNLVVNSHPLYRLSYAGTFSEINSIKALILFKCPVGE